MNDQAFEKLDGGDRLCIGGGGRPGGGADLVKPNSVIASHANEAGTQGGKPRPGSKTEAFSKASKVPVIVPLSGKTYEFDSNGRCTSGC